MYNVYVCTYESGALEVTIKPYGGSVVFDARTNNNSSLVRVAAKLDELETKKQCELYSTLFRSKSSRARAGPFPFSSIQLHSLSRAMPWPAQRGTMLCMYTMHIYTICVWCARRQRALGRMVYALTRAANEVPALELTQPRIHCIALGNNGLAILPSPLFLFPSFLPSFYVHSGSIFRFALSSFSLSGFLRPCDSSSPHLYSRRTPPAADSALLRDVYFRFATDPLSCVDFRLCRLLHSSRFLSSFFRVFPQNRGIISDARYR